jgi:hypothetical protein
VVATVAVTVPTRSDHYVDPDHAEAGPFQNGQSECRLVRLSFALIRLSDMRM